MGGFKRDIHPFCLSPLYWHLLDALNDPNIVHVKVEGGSSASKTYSCSELISFEGMRQDFSSIVFRKEGSSIVDTIFNDFKEITENFYLPFVLPQGGSTARIKTPNGNQIRFRGLDSAGKVKGLKGFRVILEDELDHFEHADYKELRRRLRGIDGATIFYTWNPVSEQHWIYEQVINKDEWIEIPKHIEGRRLSMLDEHSRKWINKRGDTIRIRTTYRDNYFVIGHPEIKNNPRFGRIDKIVLAEMERMRVEDPDDYRIYGLGLPGTIKTGQEYYNKFTPATTIKKCEPDPTLAIHASIDINSVPYMSATIHQIDMNPQLPKPEVRQIKEYALKPPFNHIEDLCDAILRDWEPYFKNGFWLYGDVHAKRATFLRDAPTFIEAMIESFRGYLSYSNIRIPESNPPHAERRRMMNRLFAGRMPFSFIIDPSCRLTALDYEKVQQDPNGGKMKKKVKEGGKVFEKYGHLSDANDYILSELDKLFFK